jgi:ATP-dependent RNA helicase SUPV3L1/SUV3
VNHNNNLLAILGPTNTGKTYFAFERLISYKSGIFGFPLRLLARENYDKAVQKLGVHKVALITGEEKILSKEASYYFCTIESMPLNIEVECVAIDEVQLAADYERGHIFTDRILHLRGKFETIFLGSTTISNILLKLFPKIKIEKRDRFSRLSFLPSNSLSKLKPRSAVIAFNINSVYEIAESLRKHKGGAAVVLGSLSPKTRNAQVEIYENKKVDYLVATDAIGMGLNLNINHVSFSALQKFDGKYIRDLTSAEIGQIAGRAGRYQNDGTFGYIKGAGSIDPLIIKSIEDHHFDNIQKIYWRNSNIDFNSINSVINSFKQFPINKFFIHKKNAEDEINFRKLSEDIHITPYLKNSTNISLLWDICRIPDFQKIFIDSYIEFLKNIFLTMIQNDRILPETWLRERIIKLENYKGGIEELTTKIANIRTWTYIANQFTWINDYKFWQEKTREIENNLSDYLHKSLTNRFVDSSASYFVDIKNRGEKVKIEADKNKSIKLNGQNYGYLIGFDLELNTTISESLFSLKHVKKSIRSMIEEKINNFLKAPPDSLNLGDISSFKVNDPVKIYWGDEPVGQLLKGTNIFSPKAEAINTEFLDSDKKILISKKLQEWADEKIITVLKQVSENIEETMSSEVRAIVFNVFNALGTMLINEHSVTIKNITEQDKIFISRNGIRIGAKFFFMPNLIKKAPMELKALLWRVFFDSNEVSFFPLPTDGRVSFITDTRMPDTYWSAIGYHCFNNFAVRVDVFERVFFLARQKIKYGPFIESSDLMNPIGCNSDQLQSILNFCGYESLFLADNKKIFFFKIKKQLKTIKKINTDKKKVIKIINKKTTKVVSTKNDKSTTKQKNKADPNSPFAVLEKLL